MSASELSVREKRALWASTVTGGGIATYVRIMQQTPLWSEWNVRHVATHRGGSAAAKIGVFARGAMQFVAELLLRRPSVVHLHTASRGSFIRKATLLWISRIMRVPVVVHMHGGGILDYYESSSPPVRTAIRTTLGQADVVVALGDAWATRLPKIAPAARIIAIPNAVKPNRRIAGAQVGEPIRVAFLGRIADSKGAFTLIDAWAELSREAAAADPGRIAVLTIAGDGDVDRARERVRSCGLEQSVEVRDWMSESDVAKLLDQSDVLVLPSQNEGQPMSVLEAMARGLCVVASDVGGLPEMIGDGCGVLVAPDDVPGLAGALNRVIHDRDLRTRCGAAAYERMAEKFDVRRVWRQLDSLYCEVTGERPSAVRG
jgi:glycosyltransferase involved in cell wall biosynthesis